MSSQSEVLLLSIFYKQESTSTARCFTPMRWTASIFDSMSRKCQWTRLPVLSVTCTIRQVEDLPQRIVVSADGQLRDFQLGKKSDDCPSDFQAL